MSTTVDRTAENRDTYDRIAPLYLRHQLEARARGEDPFRTFEEEWTARVPPGGRVADLGCGPAIDGTRFSAAGYQVVGVDLSHGMLVSASVNLPGRVVRADLRALPLRPGSLDGAWCVAALLHVPEVSTERVLGEIRLALRHDGVLALITAVGAGSRFEPVPYAPEERRWFVYRRRDRLERQVENAGFRIVFSDEVAGNRAWLTTLALAT